VARTASRRIGPTLVIGVRSENAINARLAANAMRRARDACGVIAFATGATVSRPFDEVGGVLEIPASG
jgi:hypothetical protein